MTSTDPRVLAIIVTWNKKDYVLDLLASLGRLDFPKSNLHVLVVDNASDDGTSQAVTQRFPDAQVIRNAENLGGTGGFNTGLRWGFAQEPGRFDYFWLLDDDVVVHPNALSGLLAVLDSEPDIAVAGSTMMQLDRPWRINEMGAFVDRDYGQLLLHRHLETVPGWEGQSLHEILASDADVTRRLEHCRPYMDVEYVAAASLLVRAAVARQAGLWHDFFIHFDDVEWCLRIARQGPRVVVSARSLIWHLSAAAKVPTWVLYYDNRNVLFLLRQHGSGRLVPAQRRVLKKAAYYSLLGKLGLARLHLKALEDFHAGITGKQEADPGIYYRPSPELESVLGDPSVGRVLIPWTVNQQATGIQTHLVRVMRRRPELKVDYLVTDGPGFWFRQLPGAQVRVVPRNRLLRWLRYLRPGRRYDVVLQSDYEPLPMISWLGRQVVFVNDAGVAALPAPRIADLSPVLRDIGRKWFALSRGDNQ